MKLSEGDSGTFRTLRAGEPIEIRLTENATTGYRWQLTAADEFEHLGDDHSGSSIAPGSAGVRVLTIRPFGTGLVRLRLVKQRSWEAEPVDEFVVDLEVAPRE